MTARDRITDVVEKWFLVEPLLFAVWTTHELAVNPRIRTIRVHQGRVEYNPSFIDALDRHQLEQVLALEAMRILLKHPYARRPENAELYRRYQELAAQTRNVHFVGRLGTYKYYNMDQVVAQALKTFEKIRIGDLREPVPA